MTVRPRKGIEELEAYALEPTGGLNLSNNASLFPPNPGVVEALRALDPVALRDYPSLYGERLVARLADRHDVPPEQVVTGNGSNDLIDLVIRTFTDDGAGVAYHPPSFSMIPIWARTNGAAPVPVPLTEDFSLDVDGFAGTGARVGFVCRPNNPTGNAFPLSDIGQLADAFEGLLVVDEAYISFASDAGARRFLDKGNVAVLRSLSKDAGLAGIRLGYAILPEALADELRKVRGPFRVPRLSEEVALASLDHEAHVDETIAVVRRERKRLAGALAERGLEPLPSQANFLLVRTPWSGKVLAAALAGHGVLVRDFGEARLQQHVRVTVGPPEAVDRFLEALDHVLEEGGL